MLFMWMVCILIFILILLRFLGSNSNFGDLSSDDNVTVINSPIGKVRVESLTKRSSDSFHPKSSMFKGKFFN